MKLKIVNFALLFFASLTVNFAAVVQYPTEIAADGAAAYYRVSETSGANVADASGNNRSLNLRGSYGRGSAELLFNASDTGSAATFAGGASAASNTDWYTTTTGASISLMVKFSSTAGNQDFFSSGFQGSATYGFHRFYYNGENQELKWVYNYADGTAPVSPVPDGSRRSGRRIIWQPCMTTPRKAFGYTWTEPC